jgi:hypothetical protein
MDAYTVSHSTCTQFFYTISNLRHSEKANWPPSSPDYLLHSGWDDTYQSSTKSSKPVNPPVLRVAIPLPVQSHSSPTETDSDASFAESTMHYIGSPTGRRALTGDKRQSLAVPAQRKPSDGEVSTISGIGSLLTTAAWPEPPSTVPASPAPFATAFVPGIEVTAPAQVRTPGVSLARPPPARHRLRLGGSRELRRDHLVGGEGVHLTVVTEVTKDVA